MEEARSKYNALTPAQRSTSSRRKAPTSLRHLRRQSPTWRLQRRWTTQIDAIDENAADKAERVAKARGAYNKLTDAQRKHVKKLARLEELEQQLSDEEKAKAVEALINALPNAEDVKLGDEEAVKGAESAFNALTEKQKSFVPEEAKNRLRSIREALNVLRAPIDEVEKEIKALPDAMTEDAMEALIRANDDYEALSDEEKAAVDKQALKRLEDARAAGCGHQPH